MGYVHNHCGFCGEAQEELTGMDYEIVKYRPEFKDDLIQLRFRNLFSVDVPLNVAYFEWKYERNPFLDEPLIYLALCEGKVVGMRGILGAKWEHGASRHRWLGVCATDLMVAPEHRKRGLVTRIMRMALDDLALRGHKYVFNLSANRITHFCSLADGWRGIGSLQPMIWTRKGDPWHSLDRNGKRTASAASPFVRLELLPRPEAMAELVEARGGDARIRHVRDQQYFAWRFQNPISKYRFLYWEDSRLRGYLVLRTSIHGYNPDVEIVDWEAANGSVRADLLHAAIEWGNFDSMTLWSATLPVETKALLKDAGFQMARQGDSFARSTPTVLIRPVQDEMLNEDWVCDGLRVLDLQNWDLRMIDSDAQ